MESNLSNTLGILIAFSVLMLLFSIVVTSLVQATQAVLRLRARNLWRVLTRILESEKTMDSEVPSDNAFEVLASCTSAVFSFAKKNPTDLWKTVFGPSVSWLDATQLKAALTKSKVGFTTSQVASIVSKFRQTEKASSKRFQFWARILTIFWAALIAVYFQLSTPQLLNTLSSDADKREKLVEKAEGIAKGDATNPGSMFWLEPGRYDLFLMRKDPANSQDDVIAWDNVSGVIMTVLLLSLGAPFWFNTLKYIVNLKDGLARDDARRSGTPEPGDADVDQQIAETTESIARSDDPMEKVALKAKLGDLRVLKAKMLSV